MVGNLNDATAVYYSDGFRAVLEDHMFFLRNHPNNKLIVPDPGLVYRYENDFYGLLLVDSIPYEYHWIVLRMAGFTDPAQMTTSLVQYMIPDPEVIDRLRSFYSTKNRIR